MSDSNPRGSGRKPSPPELKKIPVGMKLPRWLVEWMREQPNSQSVLIEDAICKVHKFQTEPLPRNRLTFISTMR